MMAMQIVEAVITLAAPIVLIVLLRRRLAAAPGLALVGVAVMIGAQLVHLPLNYALSKALPESWMSSVPFIAVGLGLTAGVCEEGARWLAFRYWRPDARTSPGALMMGAGHGGLESVAVGVIALLGVFNVLYLERVGLQAFASEQRPEIVQFLATARELPWWTPLLAASERLCVLAFHLAASLTVCLSVVRRSPALLLAAMGGHTVLDAGSVYLTVEHGIIATELFIAATVPFSVAAIVLLHRRLMIEAPPPPPRTRRASSGAPIELASATKVYPGEVRALDGASFRLRDGERACLLGPNGAGKTTAIRMITGAIAPTDGSAFLFGREPDEEGYAAAKSRVGIVPQQPGMYEHMRLVEYLELVRELYGRGDVHASTRALGLEDALERPLAKLSGGMQRRAVLAAALLPEPDLLILDEPSAGLDPIAARQVVDLLAEVTRGRTTLLCTHNLAEAEELCESVIILRGGRVLVHEPIEALRAKMAPQIVLAATQGSDALLAALAELGHEASLVEGEVRVGATDPRASAPALLRELLAAGVDVYECSVHAPTLEEIFLSIMHEQEVAS